MTHTATALLDDNGDRVPFGWLVADESGNQHLVFVSPVNDTAQGAIDVVTAPPGPPPPRFPTAQTALAVMRDWIERAEEQIDGGISKGERDSYLAKELEARAWQADNSAPTPILSAEAAITGESMTDLTTKVIAKADALRPIMGEIAGLRRATEIALNAVTDPHDYETILDGAIAQAISLAADRNITLEP